MLFRSVVRAFPQDEVQVLAALALIEMGLVNFGYVDGYANHFVFGLMVLLTEIRKDRRFELLAWR